MQRLLITAQGNARTQIYWVLMQPLTVVRNLILREDGSDQDADQLRAQS